jgi:hypothetical protein
MSVLAATVLASASDAGAEARRWEVTIAMRIKGGTSEPIVVRLALPIRSGTRRVWDLELTARGLSSEVVREGEVQYASFTGTVPDARRVAVTFLVETEDFNLTWPNVEPVADPDADVLPYLMPAPLFQSRSILVREFLETHVAPVMQGGDVELLRAIFEVTREELAWRADGKSLTLDVIRRRQGKRIGIERAFTTFLRCARIPARFVEGMNLGSSTSLKRVFWTEVWANGHWWPVSASRGWIGELPSSYVPLTRDGVRVVQVDGPAKVSYVVFAEPVRVVDPDKGRQAARSGGGT